MTESERDAEHEETHPKTGDVVIWDVEPKEAKLRVYWVKTQGRGSGTPAFHGPDAWKRAYAAAEAQAGPDSTIWKRHTDGHYEKLRGA